MNIFKKSWFYDNADMEDKWEEYAKNNQDEEAIKEVLGHIQSYKEDCIDQGFDLSECEFAEYGYQEISSDWEEYKKDLFQEVYIIIDPSTGSEKAMIKKEDMEKATIADLLLSGWSADDCGIDCVDEEQNLWCLEGETEKMEYSDITNIEWPDLLCVSYHDGSNLQTDIYSYDEIKIEDAIIEDGEEKDPPFYYEYIIYLSDGREKVATQSNVSGSLSPYYKFD